MYFRITENDIINLEGLDRAVKNDEAGAVWPYQIFIYKKGYLDDIEYSYPSEIERDKYFNELDDFLNEWSLKPINN